VAFPHGKRIERAEIFPGYFWWRKLRLHVNPFTGSQWLSLNSSTGEVPFPTLYQLIKKKSFRIQPLETRQKAGRQLVERKHWGPKETANYVHPEKRPFFGVWRNHRKVPVKRGKGKSPRGLKRGGTSRKKGKGEAKKKATLAKNSSSWGRETP